MEPRYIRQTQLKDFGPEGQQKLADSKVLVVGLGGLGLPALQYLNAMGVGTLGLMDQDTVELHNLQRQTLYTENDLGRSKLEVAHEKLSAQNSGTTFHLHDTFLTKDNALDILEVYDLILDATDNFPTRYLINDACVILGKPFVYGALHSFEGHVSVFNYNDGPTYRCLYPNMPSPHEVPNCNENGVLGVIPGIIGTFQALEVVKVLTGIGEVLSGKLLLFDGLTQQSTKIGFKVNPENQKIKKLQDQYQQLDCSVVPSIRAEEFQLLLESQQNITLLDVRTPNEFNAQHLNEAINTPLNRLELAAEHIVGTKEVYVICQSGKRSEQAIQQLETSFPAIKFYNVLGGMNKMMMLCP
ncbi:sulfurtransferase [Flagellimonas alvinocaridis]|uniref:Molybdopterin-synthase adenylyltransferase n=1 Tax=Flagellimonas alvinocaridis TaxID=2530200 RepID=A0A4S8RFP8_9FLAO|nr:HesA/MoeB/ThiF family protein [Allomuricauda alvinocaridis]THV57108.1 sulfurtransferase [Allomuricauda alvinocaridis]